ncbi:MAG: hypothetical protein NT123_22495 [Proteobacteria bacterium]|nr:hypothetical protein [Pseudomonadota bacterium]
MAKSRKNSTKQRCIELAGDVDGLLFADGYDNAIIGIGIRNGETIVIYDSRKVIQILRNRDSMSKDEAEEFYDFNIVGAWVGEQTPVFLTRI